MIARLWTGAVRKQDGAGYAAYLRETGIAAYAQTPGNQGVWMLRRDVDDHTEFVLFHALGLARGHQGLRRRGLRDCGLLPRGRAVSGRE